MKPAKQIAYILLAVTAVAAAYAAYELFQQTEADWDKYVLSALALICVVAILLGIIKHSFFALSVIFSGVMALFVVVAQRIITEAFEGNQLFYGLTGIFLLLVGYLLQKQLKEVSNNGSSVQKKMIPKVKSHHHKHRKRGHI
jgi:uncharacterized metal-binding protein